MMWNQKHYFKFETVAEKYLAKFVDLEEVLIECLGMLYGGL